MKKSQYSVEFMIFFAFITILFSIWLVIYLNLNQEAVEEKERQLINELGKSIQTHIMTASSSYDGYSSKKLLIPHRVANHEINLTTSNHSLTIHSERGDFTFPIPFSVGELKEGQNTLWNVNGVVCIGDNSCIQDENGNIIFP